MSPRRPLRTLAGLVVTVAALAAPASAAAAPDQELPFACGQQWVGGTRATHSPSSSAIDFNRTADYGQLVVASAAGVVSRVEDAGNRSYGRWIRIEHPEGQSTLYAHLSTQWVVPGQYVDQGVPIGRVGDTGGVSGAHLHYEQRVGRDVVTPLFHQQPFVYGVPTASQNCPDVPLAGDWNGDRTDGVAVFRRGMTRGLFELATAGAAPVAIRFGKPSDVPLAGDWDGDGVSEVGVRRQAARAFLLRRRDGSVTRTTFGQIADVPVAGDWNGDKVSEVGVWRPSTARFRLLGVDGTVQVVTLGSRGALPLTEDWDGDGDTDVAVFEPSTATFWLRTVSAAGQVAVTPVPLGTVNDLPVAGDWNGDGIGDVGVWAPGTATFTLRVTPSPSATRRARQATPELRTFMFGRPR